MIFPSPILQFFIATALLPLVACAGPLTYSAEGIEAKVIDADTKKPLEGVVVTANWQLEEGTFGGNVPAGQLMVMEAVTDTNGVFRFAAWGPKTAAKGHLVSNDPQLLLFKSGYEYRRLSNQYSGDRELRLRPVRRSDWNGRVIVLKPFKGTMEEYARHLDNLSLSWAYTGRMCEWREIPRMVFASDQQAMRFRKAGVMSSLYTIQNLIPFEGYPDRCGAKDYFRSHVR